MPERLNRHRRKISRRILGSLVGLTALLAFRATVFASEPSPSVDPAAPLIKWIASSQRKSRSLAEKLKACRAKGRDIALPDASLAVAELFCRYSRRDADQPDLRAAALKSMTYVDRMLDAEIVKADEVLAGKASYPSVPKASAFGVTWHDGGFWSGGQPIFLTGFNWDAGEASRNPRLLRRLGVNLSDGMLRGSMKRDGTFDDAGFESGEKSYLAKMARSGFPVDGLLDLSLPRWLTESTPGLARPGYGNGFDYVIERPEAAKYRERFLDHFAPLYAAQPSFFAVDLANEPAFQEPSDLMLANWREWLRRKYGGIAGVNRAWGTHLASLDDIRRYPSEPEKETGSPWDRGAVDFSRPGARGMHYDWCAFNDERISGFFRSLSDRIRAKNPRIATHVKAMMGLYFTGGTEARGWKMDLSYHTFGIDPESLARSLSLLGGDLDLIDLSGVPHPNRRFGSVPYVMGWLDAEMTEDFLKSLAPDKPYYDSEFHVTEDDHATGDPASAEGHMRTALWLAHLRGMSASLLWYWSRDESGAPAGTDWFKGSLLQQPWMLRGFAQETLQLRRFVRPAMAFSRAPRPVRLLYSEASVIQDVHYLDALRDSFEALNFLGAPVGFVTERQLAEKGIPVDARLLIVPNARYVQDRTLDALKAARRKGVVVAILGEKSLSMTPTGIPREDAKVPGAIRLPVGTPQSYQPKFDGWMRKAGVRRDLLALDASGHPAWGVEVRTASAEGRRYAYLVNLMRRPVTVTLRWRAGRGRLRDMRSGAFVGDRVTLQPRQLVFGAY